MEYVITYNGRVKDGKLHIIHRSNFDHDIELLEGKEVEITIQRKRKKRSLPQNSYYWGVIVKIIRNELYELGSIYTHKQVHGILKEMFLKVDEPIGDDGLFISRVKSSKELSTSEFMDYTAQVIRWAAEFLNCVIPDPGQQIEIK